MASVDSEATRFCREAVIVFAGLSEQLRGNSITQRKALEDWELFTAGRAEMLASSPAAQDVTQTLKRLFLEDVSATGSSPRSEAGDPIACSPNGGGGEPSGEYPMPSPRSIHHLRGMSKRDKEKRASAGASPEQHQSMPQAPTEPRSGGRRSQSASTSQHGSPGGGVGEAPLTGGLDDAECSGFRLEPLS
jgi:hypothetical protein